MGIKEFLKNLTSKKIVHVPIDEDSLTEFNINQAVLNQLAEMKAENAKLKKDLQIKRDTEEDYKEEEDVKKYLNERKEILDENKEETYFSLKNFFHKIHSDKKFRDNLYFATFDRRHKLAKFYDLGITLSGEIILKATDGNGQLIQIARGQRPKDLFWEAGSLVNDLQSGMIPLAMDQDRVPIENIMSYWEGPEIVPDKDEGFKYAKAKKKYLYEYIRENKDRISKLQDDLEDSEETNVQLQGEIDDLKRENNILRSQANNSQKELTLNEETLSGTNKVFLNLTRELAKLRSMQTLSEENIDAMEIELSELRKKALREGYKLPDDRVMEIFQRLRADVLNSQVALNMSQAPQTRQTEKEVEVK